MEPFYTAAEFRCISQLAKLAQEFGKDAWEENLNTGYRHWCKMVQDMAVRLGLREPKIWELVCVEQGYREYKKQSNARVCVW